MKAARERSGGSRTDIAQIKADAVAEYCWVAYEKALYSTGDMFIGRQSHLVEQGRYSKVAEITAGKTLFDSGTLGNVLKMDKWALVINDSRVLGGVHRRATFRLASPRHIENLWNKDGYFVVTAREMLGLVHFGYEWEQVGPWQCFVSKKLVKSQAADLLKYKQGNFFEADNRGSHSPGGSG